MDKKVRKTVSRLAVGILVGGMTFAAPATAYATTQANSVVGDQVNTDDDGSGIDGTFSFKADGETYGYTSYVYRYGYGNTDVKDRLFARAYEITLPSDGRLRIKLKSDEITNMEISVTPLDRTNNNSYYFSIENYGELKDLKGDLSSDSFLRVWSTEGIPTVNAIKETGVLKKGTYSVVFNLGYENLHHNDPWDFDKYSPDYKDGKKYFYHGITFKAANKTDNRTGVYNLNGDWSYMKNGTVNYGFSGVAKTSNGNWVYVRNGVFDTTFTGLARAASGNWYHVTKGKYDATYTGLSQAASGKWYYVRKGQYDTSYTGLAKALSGKLYYVTKGKYDTKFTGTAYYQSKKYNVTNGRVL